MDGVAYGLSSVVWHIVGASVASRDDDSDHTTSHEYSWVIGTSTTSHVYSGHVNTHNNNHSSHMGWAYGWSAVALMVIVSAVTMVEFMEHYYVRKSSGRYGGTYETILLA
jgi:hypothetical protein